MTKYNEQTRNTVMQLYLKGVPIEHIQKATSVTKTTIYKWRDKYDWIEKKVDVNKLVQGKVLETIAEIKAKQHVMIKGIQARYAEQLQEVDRKGKKKMYIGTNEVITALKHELHLMGVSEGSQDISLGWTEAVVKAWEKRQDEEKSQN